MFNRYFVSVCNIPWTICHRDLEKYFSAFGDIRHARVVFDNDGINTGYGFVEFKNKLGIQSVLNKSHILEEKRIFIIEGIAFTRHQCFKNALQSYMTDDCIAKYTSKDYTEDILLFNNLGQ